jgi:hypothetical protein
MQNASETRVNQNEGGQHKKIMVKASIRVASLNMRGFGNPNPNSPQNKWNHINQIMRDQKIGILLLQETHMDQLHHEATQNLFSRRLKIYSSEHPENPTGKGGVAVVLNKNVI